MDIKNILYELYLKHNNLTKKIIDDCTLLPSYNTLCRDGYKLKKLNSEFEIKIYLENPVMCKFCNKNLSYNDWKQKKKFCNNSCSSKLSNSTRNISDKSKKCKYCNKLFTGKIFCSMNCANLWKKEENINQWKLGHKPGYNGKTKQISPWLRRHLFDINGTACSICGWDEKHPTDKLPLTEIDHIDGDASNNTYDNLRILCPNHHSMTNTFRARNKKSTRKRK